MTGNAKELIGKGEWVACAICEEEFGRKRETKRYCSKCNQGFCEGEHGSMRFKPAQCLKCAA